MTAAATDREALLRGVLAEPDDDAPRLVFADWLEENGQAERAEFIRVQIELATYKKAECPNRPRGLPKALYGIPVKVPGCGACRWCRLNEVAAALLNSHGVDWAPRWNRVPGRGNVCVPSDFRRGFVEHVTMSAPDWLKDADTILAAHPVREVTLTTLPGWEYADLGVATPKGAGTCRLVRLQGGKVVQGLVWSVRVHMTNVEPTWYDNVLVADLLAVEWPKIKFTLPSPGTRTLEAAEDIGIGQLVYIDSAGRLRLRRRP